MYPNWILNLFTNNTCTNCRQEVTTDDITAIGVRRPEPYAAHLCESSAMILVTCKKCGQRMDFTTRYPKDMLIEAVDELIEQIESASRGKPPLFGPGSKASSPASPTTDSETNLPKNPNVRPSVRKDQNLKPVTPEEIRQFLGRMKQMSFKAGSKGMKKFFGTDRNNETEGQSDESADG